MFIQVNIRPKFPMTVGTLDHMRTVSLFIGANFFRFILISAIKTEFVCST